MIQKLEPGQIIVVGTNTEGSHWGGAATQAYKDFGLGWGVGEGINGYSYAFPTLEGKSMRPRSKKELEESVQKLYATCNRLHKLEFLLTKVGCGIAGFEESFIKSLFKNPPKNLTLPEDWKLKGE